MADNIVTVLQPPASSQLTSLATVRLELGSASGQFTDAALGKLIDRASGVISRYCGRVFGRRQVQQTFRRTWSAVGPLANVSVYGSPLDSRAIAPLILGSPDVASVDAVVEDTVSLDPAVPDYETDLAAGLLYRLRDGVRSWWSVPTIVVQFTSGFVLPNDTGPLPPGTNAPTLPADIEEVCISLVRSGAFAQGRDLSVAMDMLNGDRTQFWERSVTPLALDDDTKTILCSYIDRARY